MGKRQMSSVQGLPGKAGNDFAQTVGQRVRLGGEAFSIVAIADQRIADMGHVHADLVRTAGLEPALDERRLSQRLDEAQKRHTVTWKWVKGHAGHPENERADELAGRAAAEAANS